MDDYYRGWVKSEPNLTNNAWIWKTVLAVMINVVIILAATLSSEFAVPQMFLAILLVNCGLLAAALAWNLYRQDLALRDNISAWTDDGCLDLATTWRKYYDCSIDKHPRRIVVVSCQKTNSRGLVDSLCRRGHHVFHSVHDADLVKHVKRQSENWDLVIFDSCLESSLNGDMMVLSAIRRSCPNLPVLLV